MSYTIGRNPKLSKWINWASLALGGLIFFVNVHFSAAAMKVVAQNAGEVNFIPTAADDGFTGIAARYITAFAVSFACLLISGCFLHPNGLPTVFSELRNLEARGTSKMLGMAITILAVGVLAYGGYWAYRYDLMTTMLAFGITNLWSVAAFPVWLNVVGPEFFFHGTHFYGRLIGGGSSPAPAVMPPQGMPQMPQTPPSSGWNLFK